MAELNQTARDAIESFIDLYGLDSVVEAIATICHEKAEHVRHAWQDTTTAQPWDKAGDKLERLAASHPIAGISGRRNVRVHVYDES